MSNSGNSGLQAIAPVFPQAPDAAKNRWRISPGGGTTAYRGPVAASSRPSSAGPRGPADERIATTADLAGLRQVMADLLVPYRLRAADGGPLRASVRVARSGEVTVAVVVADAPVFVELDAMPENTYLVTISTAPGLVASVDGRAAEPGPHVVGPGQRMRVCWPAGTPVTVVRLARRLVERAWRGQGGDPGALPLRFAVPLSPAARRARVWQSLADAFVASQDSGLLSASTATSARFGALFAQTLVASQEPAAAARRPAAPTERTGAATADGVPAVPVPVRRAVHFCRAHAHEPVAVADIADAAGVSVRRLQAAFRSHLGTSPTEYLRQLRLEGVHRDLKSIAAGSNDETVTEAALRWGFTHLGRFSGIYRAEFGMLPSQTARKRPGGR